MKILVLFAHPRLSGSHVQRVLADAVRDLPGVTFHDLYAAYPDFTIDVAHEQALLVEHDLIVLQHPFYWYSGPAIIKEWLDLVLALGWVALMAPWMVARGQYTFMYHYLPSHGLALILAAGLCARIEQHKPRLMLSFVALAAGLSTYLAPVWGEFPLAETAANRRLLFQSWRP